MTYKRKLRETNMHKSKGFINDSIVFKSLDIDTGNKVGNGGNGYNSGDITTAQSLTINPYNKADAYVHTNTGDDVHQTGAHGDLTGTNTQTFSAGSNTSGDVTTTTTANQTNNITATQNSTVYAGVAGDGGSDNMVWGGDVHDFLNNS
jgi:hypothetical protein